MSYYIQTTLLCFVYNVYIKVFNLLFIGYIIFYSFLFCFLGNIKNYIIFSPCKQQSRMI